MKQYYVLYINIICTHVQFTLCLYSNARYKCSYVISSTCLMQLNAFHYKNILFFPHEDVETFLDCSLYACRASLCVLNITSLHAVMREVV